MPRAKSNATLRGMGRITPNPNGTFTLRWTQNGKQPERTFSSKALAEDFQAEIWRAKRAGETVFAGKGSESKPFVTYCLEWIGSGGRRESTATVYRSTLKCMLRIAPELASMTVAQVAKDRPLAKRLIQQAPASAAGVGAVRVTVEDNALGICGFWVGVVSQLQVSYKLLLLSSISSRLRHGLTTLTRC
jgi:hypothetical protein